MWIQPYIICEFNHVYYMNSAIYTISIHPHILCEFNHVYYVNSTIYIIYEFNHIYIAQIRPGLGFLSQIFQITRTKSFKFIIHTHPERYDISAKGRDFMWTLGPRMNQKNWSGCGKLEIRYLSSHRKSLCSNFHFQLYITLWSSSS